MRSRLLALLAVAPLTASLWAGAGGAGAAPADERRAEHERVVKYWTPARRAAAVPRDVAARKGPPGGGGGGGGATVTGATWTGGGDVVQTTGKVFFSLGSSSYVCSGSAVTSAGRSLVLTAGHCVHDGNGGDFATNWIFYPAWNGRPDPALGAWTAASLFTTPLWANTENGFDDDAGFAVVGDGAGGHLEDVLAGRGVTVPGIRFDGPPAQLSSETYSAFGYPAAGKYKGNTLTYCSGTVRLDLDADDTMAMACNMTGGSSGGPWLVDYAGGARVIESLNSYGYSSLKSTMFGPIFGPPEEAAYTAAAHDACTASGSFVCAG